MVEPEGRAGQAQSPEISTVSGNPAGNQRSAPDPALGDGVPPFRGQSTTAPSLDLLVDMDEPEEVILELKRIASTKSGPIWRTVYAQMHYLESTLKERNRPGGRLAPEPPVHRPGGAADDNLD